MSLKSTDKGNKDYEQTPAGTHLAICYLLADIGIQPSQYYEPKEKVIIGWELPNELMSDGRPFACSKMYTNSTNEKANLRKDLESWRSKMFTEQEAGEFDLKAILGAPCQITIVHERKGEKTFSNVSAVTSVVKGMNVPRRVNPLVHYDMDAPVREDYDRLPNWIKKKIDSAIPKSQQTGYEYDERNPPPFVDNDIPF